MSELFLRPLFTWRSAIASPRGPKSPTTRLVLLTISLHMSERGDSCFPSTRTISEESGLSHRAVIEHIDVAEKAGWLGKRERKSNGKGWRRMEYVAQVPAAFEVVEPTGKAAGRPEQHRAWRAVANALESGRLIRQPCEHEECLDPDTDAHHDDYSKPLEVRWLCKQHHSLFHMEHRDDRGASANRDDSGASRSDGDYRGAHRDDPGAHRDDPGASIVVHQGHLSSSVNSSSNSSEKKPRAAKRRIPPDFGISDEVRGWAKAQGFAPYLDAHLVHFLDYAKASSATYADWDAAFRNCIRADWGNVRRQMIARGAAPPPTPAAAAQGCSHPGCADPGTHRFAGKPYCAVHFFHANSEAAAARQPLRKVTLQ